MKFIKIFFLTIGLGIYFYSCGKNYLDKRPLGPLDEMGIANKKGVEGLLIGAYSLLDGIGGNKSGYGSAASNWLYGSICGGEACKGSDENDQNQINSVEEF